MVKIARQAASRLRENRLERRRFLLWLWPLAILAGLGTQPATMAKPVKAFSSPSLASPNPPQPITAPNRAEAFLARLRQAYAGRSVLRMDFSQTARLGWVTRHATGILWLDLHGMLRMEYTYPSRYAFKTDGVDAWRERLDPDDDSIRLAHTTRWPAWFPLRNLLDLDSLLQEYAYTIPDSSKLGSPDDIVLRFTARYPSTTFPRVEVAFSATTLQPRQMEYVDRGGFIEHYVFGNLSFDCPEAKAPKFFREAPGKTPPTAQSSKRPGKQSIYQPVSWSTVSQRSFERVSLSRLIISPLGTVCAATYAGLVKIATDGSWEYLSRRSVLDVATTNGGLALASADGLAWHDKNAISSPRFIYDKTRVSALTVQSSRLWFLTVERNQSPVIGSIALDDSGRPVGSPELKQAPPRVRSLRAGPGRLLLVQQLSREWSAYDPQTGQLRRLPFAQDDEVFDAANTTVGLFILHSKGLSWLDSSLQVTKLDVDAGDGEGSLGLSNDGYRLLIGRWPALYELDLSSLQVRRKFVLPGANNRKKQTLLPTAVAQDWLGRFWVGTSEGLYITDPDEKRSKVLTFTLSDEDAALQTSKEHLHDLFGSLREIKSYFMGDAPQGRFPPINAGFAADGSLWLSGADRLVLQDKDANSETQSSPLKTLSSVIAASVIHEPIVASSSGLLQLKSSGNMQLLPPAHGSAHELLDGPVQQRSLLTRTLLGMPAVQELMFDTFSFAQLGNIGKDDNLLTMAENRFGRSHMSAWPWFSYQILAASADEVLVRTVPKAGSESPLTLVRTDSDGVHLAVLPNTLPKTKLAKLIQEPASGDWIVQTESGHLYRSPRSLGGFREITLPQDIDDRGVRELQLLVGADSTARALLKSQSRLWIHRDGKWLSLPAEGEPTSTQPAQSDISLMSRITADGSQRAIQQLHYGKLNQQRLAAALSRLPGTSAPTPGPELLTGARVPLGVADTLLLAANRIRRALGVTGELGPILGHVSDGADELVLTQQGLVRLGQKTDQAERVELVDWPNEVTEKGTLLVRLPSGHILVAAGEPAAGRSRLWSHRVRGEPFVSLPTAPSWVLSASEQPDGSLLLGVHGGRAIRLTSRGQIEPGPRILPRGPYERPLGPYYGVCPLRGQRALIVPYTLDTAVVSAEDAAPVWIKQDVRPFQNCVDLGDDRYMLRHWDSRLSVFDDKTQTVQDLDFVPKTATSTAALIRSQDNDPSTSHPTIILVVDGALQRFNFSSQRFERLGALPRRSLASPNILAVERDAVWSASAGLWRITLPKTPSKETLTAQLWDEQDGLPTLALTGIQLGGSGLNKGEILITHPGGLSRLKPEGDHFLSESLSGSLPTADQIRAARLLSIKGHRLLVLVAADGIHLAAYNAQTTDLSVGATWKYRFANVAQSPESPLALAYLPASSELVFASDTGVRTYKVDVLTQSKAVIPMLTESSSYAPPWVLRQADGLQLVNSPDGSQLYMLVKIPQSDSTWMPQSNYRLLRYARSDGWQLDKSDGDSGSLLLENAQRAWLGPSVAGAAPQVLVQDSNDQFVLFRMSKYKVPKLLVEQGIFGITAQVLPNSLDPKDATAQHWRASFNLNELPEGKPVEHNLFYRYFLNGLLTEQRGTVFVRLLFDDLEPYVLSQSIPAYQGFAVRRVVILSLLTLLCVSMIGYVLVRLRRNRRLAARFMPYVQGGAIRDPEQFFGRQSLLATLCSHIAVANYALVGDFRIGKSSIQHQLTRRLTELNQQTYRYFPFYVDLERLNDIQGSDFFYLLGHGLCELLANSGVSEDSIKALKASNAADPTTYNTRHFQRDLQCALDALAPQSAPRQPMIVIQIDEIALVENFQPMLLINFRGVFQNQPHVRTILTGRHLPQDGEEFRQSPWWNFLREEIVGPLSPKEARELITMPTRGYFQVSPAAIDRVLSITGGRPQQIQRLCADLLTYKYTQGTRKWRATPITLDDVEAVLQEQERSLSKPGVQP